MNTQEHTSLSFKSFLILILDNLRFVVIFTSIVTVTTILYSLIVTPIYESTASLTHSSASSRSQSSSSSIQSVANIVSADLGGEAATSSEAKIAISRILSRDYFKRIYNDQILLSCLSGPCDLSSKNSAEPDKESTSINTNKPPFMVAYRHFRSVFNIFPNKEIVTFSFRHSSPEIAQEFLTWLVSDTNNFIRDHDVDQANRTIDFLNERLTSTRNLELQKLISALIQKEIQTLSLSEKTEYFAFEIVDSPFVPQNRIYPKRSLMVVGAFIFSIFLSISMLVLEASFQIITFVRSLEIKKRIRGSINV